MGVIDIYLERTRDGSLKPDAAQAEVALRLSALADELSARPPGRAGLLRRIFGGAGSPPRGIYIHGPVGRGKTMLMDLFFESVENWPRRRVHFHEFMQDIHRRRAELRHGDVVAAIADQVAAEALLLCLDEMQIVDVADAMIVGRLYEALHARGVVLVTTSNDPPHELYRDGLNRQLFLAFIAKLEATLDVVALAGTHDYRLGRLRGRETFIHPLGPDADAQLESLWNDLTDGASGQPVDLAVVGRTLRIPRAAHGCARLTFGELCGAPLGPPDYLAIAARFGAVIAEGIPKLQVHERNEARRLVLMIDTFYDAGTRFAASAAGPPDAIWPPNAKRGEFARTISRLREMQSAAWWGRAVSET